MSESREEINVRPIKQSLPQKNQFFNAPKSDDSPDSKMTDFYTDLEKLFKAYSHKFNSPEPFLFKGSWKNDKENFQKLEEALKIAQISKQDFYLFQVCRSISSSVDTTYLSFLLNDFSMQIRRLLTKYTNKNLPMNFPDDLPLYQKYQKLMTDYTSLLTEYEKLKKELEISPTNNSKDDMTSQFEQLQVLKDQVIKSLSNEVSEGIQENQKLTGFDKKTVTLEDYEKQNIKLKKRLETLDEQIRTLFFKAKTNADEVKLLTQKTTRLKEENETLNKELKNRDHLISDLKKQILGQEPSMANTSFFNVENLKSHQIKEVDKFKKAYEEGNKALLSVEDKLKKFLDDDESSIAKKLF